MRMSSKVTDGCTITFCCGPATPWGKHRHNGDFEVFFILKGQGLYDDNGSQTTVKAGDVTVCRQGEEHALRNDGPDDLEMIALILFSGK